MISLHCSHKKDTQKRHQISIHSFIFFGSETQSIENLVLWARTSFISPRKSCGWELSGEKESDLNRIEHRKKNILRFDTFVLRFNVKFVLLTIWQNHHHTYRMLYASVLNFRFDSRNEFETTNFPIEIKFKLEKLIIPLCPHFTGNILFYRFLYFHCSFMHSVNHCIMHVVDACIIYEFLLFSKWQNQHNSQEFEEYLKW